MISTDTKRNGEKEFDRQSSSLLGHKSSPANVVSPPFDSVELDQLMSPIQQTNGHTTGTGSKKCLTAETLKILSSTNVDNLTLKSRFELLFNDLSMLQSCAVQGLLAKTSFRFLAWMIFLECIPFEKSEWLQCFKTNRTTFENIRSDVLCDPRNGCAGNVSSNGPINDDNQQMDASRLDTSVNDDHPLSHEKQSIWNKYFSQNKVKCVIEQDVVRINQHSSFFTLESTKQKLIDLLFIYVQATQTEYRQGMHEILSCIMYVVHEEYTHLSNSSDCNDVVKEIVNIDYLEHDTFTIFQAIMQVMYNWYSTNSSVLHLSTESNERKSTYCLNNPKHNLSMNPRLYQEEDKSLESEIICKLNFITDRILRNNDIEIYNHLNNNDVSVHPFGIRWLRLLFLRELEFPSCLILWDAIFAIDSYYFNLVNYIFVALLTHIREDLLHMDTNSCMHLLMQPQLNLDPLDVLKTALYFYDPAIFSRPLSMESYEIINNSFNKYTPMQSKSNQNISPSVGAQPNRQHHSSQPSNTNKVNANHHHHHQQHQQQQQQQHPNVVRRNQQANTSNRNDFENVDRNEKKDYPMKLFSIENYEHNVDLIIHVYKKKIVEIENENQQLRLKLAEMEELCNMSSMKMNASIILLQEEITSSQNLKDDDDVLLALAGLKQVRDQLNPTFRVENEDGSASNTIQKQKQLKYKKYQEHKETQTIAKTTLSLEDLTATTKLKDDNNNNNNDNNNSSEARNDPKQLVKRRFSLFHRKSSLVSDEDAESRRQRTYSLAANIPNNEPTTSSAKLDEESLKLDFKNMKLTLNQSN